MVKVVGIINLALKELGFKSARYYLERLLLAGLLLEIILLSYDLAKRTQLMRQKLRLQDLANQEMQSRFQKELLQAQLEIQEKTLQSVSEEIHDNIGQMLLLLNLNLQNLMQADESQKEEIFEDARDNLTQVIQDLRDLSKTMNSDLINQVGITKAVEIELKAFHKAAHVETTFNCNVNFILDDPQRELILFRIIQEALHNILKHASATKISIQGNCDKNILELEITDNGIGFNNSNTASGGSGLMNMRNRCRLINAHISINSSPGNGTSIVLRLPKAWPKTQPVLPGASIYPAIN